MSVYSFCSLNAEMALISARTGGLRVHSTHLGVKTREFLLAQISVDEALSLVQKGSEVVESCRWRTCSGGLGRGSRKRIAAAVGIGQLHPTAIVPRRFAEHKGFLQFHTCVNTGLRHCFQHVPGNVYPAVSLIISGSKYSGVNQFANRGLGAVVRNSKRLLDPWNSKYWAFKHQVNKP